MRFFTSRRRQADAAEAARQQQRAEYEQALTRIINQRPGRRDPAPAQDPDQQDQR